MAEGFELGAGATHLLERYVAELPGKALQIEDLWQRLKEQPADRDALANLSLHVHRLAGSAAPYGLPALSEAARSVDRLITPLARGGAMLPTGMLAALQPLMDRLKERMLHPS